MGAGASVTATFDWTAPPKTDFNGDGDADIFWRHSTQGILAVWLMDGINLTGAALTNPSAIDDPQWQIAGTGDFNGDGKPDILWRHATQAIMAVWFMDGLNLVSASLLNPSAIDDPAWEIASVADFNADGKPDILWRHSTQGIMAVWYLDGINLVGASLTNPSAIDDIQWQIQATGDFNSDGKPDILWRHATQGIMAVWFMDGISLTAASLTNPSAIDDIAWQIAGAADFNSDGQPDILWRHSTQGIMAVWFMDGVNLTAASLTNPSAIDDPAWQIAGMK
jgi:hypothetical protein